MVLVNHYANAATSAVLKTAHHAAATVNLNIATGTYNFSWKQNREVHHRAYRDVAIHREKNAVCRYILRLRGTGAVLRHYFNRQMQRKPRRTLHCGIVLDRSLGLLRVDPGLFLCCFARHRV
jgi:hypothetical protein